MQTEIQREETAIEKALSAYSPWARAETGAIWVSNTNKRTALFYINSKVIYKDLAQFSWYAQKNSSSVGRMCDFLSLES